jgi:hypothetical protein
MTKPVNANPRASIAARNSNDLPSGRRSYAPPQLKVFGPVGALTQAGTGNASESMGMMIIGNSMLQRA